MTFKILWTLLKKQKVNLPDRGPAILKILITLIKRRTYGVDGADGVADRVYYGPYGHMDMKYLYLNQ